MKSIDAIVGSPPDKERLAVEFFDTRSNFQWATVDVEEGKCMLELYPKASPSPVRVDLQEAIAALVRAKERLEESYPDVIAKPRKA